MLEAATMQQMLGGHTHVLASWLFLRLLGLIYFCAFVSLALQIRGLFGREGILPAFELLAGRRHWGQARFWRWPTLCWVSSSNHALLALSWCGAGLALLLIFGLAPIPILILLWLLYLSLFTVGRIFLCFQWDILLLESGFLAVFLAPPQLSAHLDPVSAPAPMAIWLFWWLLFRLMFWSGAVKLRSGDVAWRKLTALKHHYETQPLPTPLAWYAYQLPGWFHRCSVVLVLAIELVVPFFIFINPAARHIAAGLFILLMVLIQLSGNYAFFNLLGIALSVLLLDDALLLPLFRAAGFHPANEVLPAPVACVALTGLVGVLVAVLSVNSIAALLRREITWPERCRNLFDRIEPLRLVNTYGLFAVMTTWRPEIIIEGSQDGYTWKEYEFRCKPGSERRAPRLVAPHQPRLDWQMWFAALGGQVGNYWLKRFCDRLIEGAPDVIKLLAANPFPNAPPRFVRGVYYDYRFTDRAERRKTGAWWHRERRGTFSP